MASDSEDTVAPSNPAEPELQQADDAPPNGAPAQGDDETEVEDDNDDDEDEDDSEDEDEDDEEEEEPKLKYARLTSQLGPLYRNGDATSSFLVAGDKMFVGTHNGNIHVVSLPAFQPLRPYKAHSASITSISISPFPPPLTLTRPEATRIASQAPVTSQRPPSIASVSTTTTRNPPPDAIPNTPSNAVYIATSSIDGNVCVASLVDRKDVQLRNFARPVQAVALSPEYKNDRTYLSGGLAGNLVMTVGGKAGTSSNSTTTGTAAATASGWLGSIGLGGNHAKDTILHYGEGTISTIKWSLSGKFVVWANEHGVKIMRSHLHLDSADADFAWKRIGHIDRPDEDGWEEMAGVWKARIEWIDEKALGSDDGPEAPPTAPIAPKFKHHKSRPSDQAEKLLVGWGGTIWVINIHSGGVGTGKNAGEKIAGRPEIVKILKFDCIISGLSLYTPTLLLALCYVTPEEDEEVEEDLKGHKSKNSTASTGSEPRGGIRRRQNALPPELRLIDLASSEEVEVDTDDLTVSRYERLSAADYHLGVLPAPRVPQALQTSRGTLEVLSGMGSGMWNATLNATSLLSSAASVRSVGSTGDGDSASNVGVGSSIGSRKQAHPMAAAPGLKIFIHSPYDCILAVKRDLQDHLAWILDQHKYEQAWELVNEHPEVIASSPERLAEIGPDIPLRHRPSIDEFFDESASTLRSTDSPNKLINSAVEKEKRRIGELWIQQLIEANDWETAGRVCGKVLGTSPRWEHWVYAFAGANKFDEITPHLPTLLTQPPLPTTIYEVILGHYIAHNRPRMLELLDAWSVELFNVRTVTDALENLLKYRDVREDSVENGERGRDWRIVQESLGKLYVADGRPREALKCYIRLQDADAAMALIKDFHLVDAVADDIPGLILLRISKEQLKHAPTEELEDASSEAITLLVREAHHGLVRPEVVVKQLREKKLTLFLFFYLRSLWLGEGIEESNGNYVDQLVSESKSLVDEFADLAVELFATYDRSLLMDFLKTSTFYAFEKASQVCEEREFVPELVYLYSKTGQTKRALFLIIDKLSDVSQAIEFTKQQDDPELWEDLLDYSMDKPRFIRGLLEEVGTAIDPIRLVRRIPEGLAIEGLREGLSRMIKEYEIQHSISSGVAKVLRGEVASVQNKLRAGQRRGIKFEVPTPDETDDKSVVADSSVPAAADSVPAAGSTPPALDNDVAGNSDSNTDQGVKGGLQAPKPGHCADCGKPLYADEVDIETLVGFACGHVFHLQHLLQRLHPDRPVSPEVLGRDGYGDDGNVDGYVNVRSVGAKVTHARLLKDQLEGGCPLCVKKRQLVAQDSWL